MEHRSDDWNSSADVQRLPRAELTELRDRRLRDQIRLVAQGHPYYGPRMTASGVGPSDIRGVADLPLLAVSSKQDFLADPESFRLRAPESLPLEERILAYVVYTTGTTSGEPAPVYQTTSDDWAFQVHARRCAEMVGLTSADVIANVFPLTPFPMGAYVRAGVTAAAVGASLVRTNTGSSNPRWPVHRRMDEALDLLAQHQATVVWGIAGFVRRLLIRAADRGMRLADLRWAFVTGEATSEAGLADLRTRLRDVGSQGEIANRYGSTEGWSMIVCPGGQGWHNPTPEMIHLETVDPETHEPVADGESGLLLVTHLVQRGTVFMRYALGDIVRLNREPCPDCGRTSERIVSQPVRSKSLVKIKGTLVNLGGVADILAEAGDLSEHRVIVDSGPDGLDRLRLQIAPRDGVAAADLSESLVQRVVALTHLTPQVEVVKATQIFDPLGDAKPVRVRDDRA